MNNRLFVKNLPSIQEREFKYRAKMSSHQLNELQQEAFNDILDLFNKANQLQKQVYEMNIAENIESSCYSQRLTEAMTAMNYITEAYNNITSIDGEFRYVSRYAFDARASSTGYGAVVDKNTNDVIAHIISSTSKVRLHDDVYDETLVPESLQVFIGPDTFRVGGNIYTIEDSEVRNAFDGNPSTVWFRRVVTNTDVESIENELVIGLPEDIITSRLMNQIVLKPFPVGFEDILDIQYKSHGAWESIPGLWDHYGVIEHTETDIFGNSYDYKSIDDATALKFNFAPVQTNQLKIKLRQRHYEYDAERNRRIWYLGIRNLNVNYNVYTKDHSEFEMVYEFQEKLHNIKVYDAEIYFNNKSVSDDESFGISKEYFYYDDMGNTHKIASTAPFILSGHKMMVRYTIQGNQYTPNVYMTRIKYKLA